MKIAVLSHHSFLENESDIINQLFEAGLEYFHIKKTKGNSHKISKLISKIDSQYYDRIVLHKNYDKACKYKLRGVHFTNKHREHRTKMYFQKLWLMLRYKKIRYTMSYHSIESLTEDQDKYDYSFLSPVFGSTTKKHQPGFNPSTLKSILSKTKKQVFALGGVSNLNILDAYEMGFDGVVLSTYLWNSDSPVADFKEAQEIARKLI